MYIKFDDKPQIKYYIIVIFIILIYLTLRFSSITGILVEVASRISLSDIIIGLLDKSFIYICIGSIIGSFTAVVFTGILNSQTERKKIKKNAVRAANILSKDYEINIVKILSYRNQCDDKNNSIISAKLDKLIVCDNWRMYYHDLYLYTQYDYYSCLTTFYRSIDSINSAIDEMNLSKVRREIYHFDALEFQSSTFEFTPNELYMNLISIIMGEKEKKPFFEDKNKRKRVELYGNVYGKVIENKVLNLLITNKKISLLDLNLQVFTWLLEKKCEIKEISHDIRVLYKVIEDICYQSEKISIDYPFVSLCENNI